jgi:bacterioferritin-associated ferredoxin
VRDADLATTVPGVFAAGDGAGVAGSLVAAHEGRLAGLAASRSLGAMSDAAFAAARRPIDAELAPLLPIRRALDRISAIRPGLAELVTDDTIVCRCEDVTAREMRTAVAAGCTRYRTLKVVTRIGMGACQGRFCWPSVARIVAVETRTSAEDLGPASARPPARPVTMASIAALPKDGA